VVEPVAAGPGGPVARSAKEGFEHLEFAPYVAVADEPAGPWDLVVVDGRARGACLTKALEVIAPDGVVLVDNVERDRNRDAVLALGDSVEVVWTRGLTPCLPYPSGTALVRRR
jgi:predicted O-methyltransferase YrrM